MMFMVRAQLLMLQQAPLKINTKTGTRQFNRRVDCRLRISLNAGIDLEVT